MATLVLGAVGAIVGGPAGFLIGTAIGQRVDQRLLGPKRRGPRLGDLAVQSSTYGAPIPKIFGQMRVAGSVIWSTDLIETRRKRSNGKGQPKTTVYSYAASFAVALSARRVESVGRIWADGKLLRGAAGDFKSETGFRLHQGGEDQPIDPLIAAAEGLAETPAYRGLAYAVFEDFQLGDYGNRIPSLSFEVFGDAGPVTVGAVVSELSGVRAADDTVSAVAGFAALGDSVRSVAETIADAIPLALRDDGGALTLADDPGPLIAVTDFAAGAAASGERRTQFELRAASEAPRRLTIGYYDVARDYQIGLQAARRESEGRAEARADLPAALMAADAKSFAEARLSELSAGRRRAKVSLPWRYMAISPGHRIVLPGDPLRWRVAATALARGVVELDLIGDADAATGAIADAGRHAAQPDLVEGPTSLILIDLPPLGDSATTTPQVVAVAAGVSPGWRRAGLLASTDGGVGWRDAGQTAAPAIMGKAVTALGAGTASLTDRVNSVDVALLNAAMQLGDADAASLLRSVNLASIGGELIQFGRAQPLGGGVWRLSELLRGRRGTEFATTGHAVNEPFVLIEADALAAIEPVAIGQQLDVMASGLGDATPALADLTIAGNACLPLSPVHVYATLQSGGETLIAWTRRSRSGWQWPDGIDAPLGEESERYVVAVSPSAGLARAAETTAPEYSYTAAERAADIAGGAAAVTFAIRQAGSFGVSRAAALTLNLI